jgi:hypothetical protein
MDALRSRQRFRIVAVLEWLLAAGFLFALFTLGQLIVRELRAAPSAPAAAPVARALTISVPAAVPSRAVSVPMLPFQDGKVVKVGDTMRGIAEAFGRAAEVGRQEVDRGRFGERLTRFYEYGSTRFILVFEPFEMKGEPKVAGIYLP